MSTTDLIGRRILFLGAHADDIEIGCGGTAAKYAAAGRAIAFAQAADCGRPFYCCAFCNMVCTVCYI